MVTESLRATEAECTEGRTAPRVSLADIERNVIQEYYLTGSEAARASQERAVVGEEFTHSSLDVLTICILVVQNGFTIIGKSAPASAANFDAELGRRLAYEDAIRQIWPLMGYALREKLSAETAHD